MREIFDKFTEIISKKEKLAFVSTFIIGMAVHLFMLANKIPNHDDIIELYDAMKRLQYGRWFLFFPAQISGKLSMPWFTGLLGIFYISLSVVVLVYYFKIKSQICIIAFSALIITFPTIATTFNYMQCSDGYFFALLLSCIAICLVSSRKKWCWAGAFILFILSLGIYQAYLPFAVSVLIIWHINQLLVEDEDPKKVFLSGIKCICVIGISIVAYLVLTNLINMYYSVVFARSNAVVDLSLRNIPHLIVTAYKESLGFYLTNKKNVHYVYMKYLYILMFGLSIVFSVFLFKKYDKDKNKIKILLLIVLYIILPLAAGLIYLMCAYESIHMVMVYGMVALVLFPVILVDKVEESNADGLKTYFVGLGQIAVVFIAFIASFNYAYISNKAYFALYMTYEQSYAYANRLLVEIQMENEYDKEDTIILVGTPGIDTRYTMEWRSEKDLSYMTGTTRSLILINEFPLYLKYYLGVEQEVFKATSLERLKELGVESNIDELSCYPDAGSIICEENAVIVKFSDVE